MTYAPTDIASMAEALEVFLRHKLIEHEDAQRIARELFTLPGITTPDTDFHFLPCDGSIPTVVPGWSQGSLSPGLEKYGKDFVAFAMSKPKPGDSILDPKSSSWVVCVPHRERPATTAPKTSGDEAFPW